MVEEFTIVYFELKFSFNKYLIHNDIHVTPACIFLKQPSRGVFKKGCLFSSTLSPRPLSSALDPYLCMELKIGECLKQSGKKIFNF